MIDNQTNRADYLLSCPTNGEQPAEDVIERLSCSYENKSERFMLKERNFDRQYAHIYAVRLMEMRKTVAVSARRKWGQYGVDLCKSDPTGFYSHVLPLKMESSSSRNQIFFPFTLNRIRFL